MKSGFSISSTAEFFDTVSHYYSVPSHKAPEKQLHFTQEPQNYFSFLKGKTHRRVTFETCATYIICSVLSYLDDLALCAWQPVAS